MSAQVIRLSVPMTEADYQRPELSWVKRRARRLQRFFKVPRTVAIAEAFDDYGVFTQMHRNRLLTMMRGAQDV